MITKGLFDIAGVLSNDSDERFQDYIDHKNLTFNVYHGDALEQLKRIPFGTVNTCITSPPYYGLRDYGTGTWVGGDPTCPHRRTTKISKDTITGHKHMSEDGQSVGDAIYKKICPLCGAVREDKQIGLEETPEEYIERLVQVFREVRRVLKDDGTLWVNIGDSYAGGAGRYGGTDCMSAKQTSNQGSICQIQNTKKWKHDDIKQKDLLGIPWMLAFALRSDGWYLRQDIIWAKSNPMPESVKDRFTKSHEHIFMLTKNPVYYFNHDAVQEDTDYIPKHNIKFGGDKYGDSSDPKYQTYSGKLYHPNGKRNKRDVWSVPVSSTKESHFATFPKDLIEPCILAGCPKNGVVLDPFNGSGTTGIVATDHCRSYIGIELNSEYIEITKRRVLSECHNIEVQVIE